MNKICTSIEQTKKLIGIGIDVNTADLTVIDLPIQNGDRFKFINNKLPGDIFPSITDGKSEKIPAWSLSALLGLMPKSIKGITTSDEEAGWPQYFYYPRLLLTDKEMWQCIYKEYNGAGASKCWTIGESPIDACVEMILKLHELNLL